MNTVDAVYAFMKGNESNWSRKAENAVLKLDGKQLPMPQDSTTLGYVKTEKTGKASVLSIDKKSEYTSWGAVYAEFKQPISEIGSMESGIKVRRVIVPAESACFLGFDFKKQRQVDNLLKKFKLYDKRNSIFTTLSGGERQRVLLLQSLLPTPNFLILDEPVNGLDPAGIVEIRNLLKTLNREYGMTILVSSHILEELYQTATEFILLDHGNIIEEISDHELNERCKRHIAIQTTDVQKAVMVLEENLHTDHFKLMPDGTIRLYDHLDDLEMVASVLSEAHVLVTGLFVSGDTLEDYFLSKIGGAKDGKSPENGMV